MRLLDPRSTVRSFVVLLLTALLGVGVAAGRLTIAEDADLTILDPQLTYQSSLATAWTALYDPLLNRDANLNIVPWLATSWEMESETSWLLTLRDDVTFHNGEKFDAAAVVANIDRIIEPGFQQWNFMAGVEGAVAVDEYTVRITTLEPMPTFLGLMTMFYQVPPAMAAEQGSEGLEQHPTGTGPFRFVERVADSHLSLVRNDDWWGELPEWEELVFRIIPEASTRIAALRAGEVDIAKNIPPDQASSIESDPRLRIASIASVRTPYIAIYPDSPMGGGEPLADVRVRRALNHAVDRESIIEFVLAGRGTMISSLLTPGFLGFNEDVEPYAYDPELAKELLAEAGFPDGFSLTLEVASNLPMPKPVEIGQAITANLQAVGIDVELSTPDRATMLAKQRERTWAPLAMWSYGASNLDSDSKFWGPFSTGGSMHFISPPELNELIAEARSNMDADARAEMYRELHQMVHDMALTIPLFAQHDVYGYRAGLSWEPVANEVIPLLEIVDEAQ